MHYRRRYRNTSRRLSRKTFRNESSFCPCASVHTVNSTDAARREILDRLLALNHERHEEEEAQSRPGDATGKQETPGKKAPARTKRKDKGSRDLDFGG